VLAACPVIELVSSDSINEAFCVSEQFSRVSILPIVPDDLQRPMQDLPHKAGMSRSGSLADPDCTMYGRAVRAYASVPDMIKAGYLPYPIAPLNPDAAPVSRSKRGRSRGLCAGCPFQSLFDHLQERRISVISDTGCSLISMFPPYSFGLANYGMGSSVGVASHSTGVALIGDYALLHSGIQALMDLHAKGHPVLCIVLQNRCMGTTGRQPVPEILPYVAFADPVVCIASEHDKISGLLVPGTKLRVIVIQGACPEEGCI